MEGWGQWYRAGFDVGMWTRLGYNLVFIFYISESPTQTIPYGQYANIHKDTRYGQFKHKNIEYKLALSDCSYFKKLNLIACKEINKRWIGIHFVNVKNLTGLGTLPPFHAKSTPCSRS